MRQVKLAACHAWALTRLQQHGNVWNVVSMDCTRVVLKSLQPTMMVTPALWEHAWGVVKFEKDPNFHMEWLKGTPDAQPKLATDRHSEQGDSESVGRS